MTIKEIFQTYGGGYLARFADDMPSIHRQVIHAIASCRTPSAGTTVFQCDQCGSHHSTPCSCGNRHCPTCQGHKTLQWLHKSTDRLVPGHHFMLTFTIPQEIRRFIRSHQRMAYAALFTASSAAIKKLAPDPKYLGGDLPGFFGVLHTWGRTAEFHPHVHYIVPGGAFSTDDNTWHPSRKDFYLPVKALSKIYRAKFRDIMERNDLLGHISPEVWNKEWNVHAKPVGNGRASIKYLAPYIFRVALSDRRIVKVENDRVFFRYRKPKSRRPRIMALDAIEFIRRFLQHVLPSGFMKVRYYGFMNPNAAVPVEKISACIKEALGNQVQSKSEPTDTGPPLPRRPSCGQCGGTLLYRFSIRPNVLREPLPSG